MGAWEISETRDYWQDKVLNCRSVVSGWIVVVAVVAMTQIWALAALADAGTGRVAAALRACG